MNTITFIFFIFILGFILFSLFTKNGRALTRKRFGEVVKDYGVIDQQYFYGVNQKTRLFQMKKENETFYLLEIERGAIGGFKIDWIKLNGDTLRLIKTIIK